VCAVQLDGVDPQPVRPLRRGDEGIPDAIHPGAVERRRCVIPRRKRRGRRRDDLPTICIARRDLLATLPRDFGRRLAAGMRELDRDRHVGPAPHPLERPRHRRLGGVVPQPDVAIGDPPLGQHRGRLDRQQRGARQREMTQVDHVPVGHAAIDRRILAHRRDHDAIGELHRAEAERFEQSGSGHRILLGAAPTRDGGAWQRRSYRTLSRARR